MYGVHYTPLLAHITSGNEGNMKQFLIDEEISEKLREFITQKFQARGRFNELESLSGIGASKWKNFFYKKQEATQELIQFWSESFTDYQFPYNSDERSSLFPTNSGVSERLRDLVRQRFQSRGRFSVLESVSGISASKWKNFFYKKQEATQELLQYWCENFPDSKDWLLTGLFSNDNEDYPFSAPVPSLKDSKKLTLADRLMWVISEWASPNGEQLFEYLSQRSGGSITPNEWAKMIQRTDEPTSKMISVVCMIRPYFTEWIITGRSSPIPQVDPTDSRSIQSWKEHMQSVGIIAK